MGLVSWLALLASLVPPHGLKVLICVVAWCAGHTRVKFAGGWVSDKASDGRQILELIEDLDEPVE